MIELRDRLAIDDRIEQLRALASEQRVERAIRTPGDVRPSVASWRDAVASALVRVAEAIARTPADDPCADAPARGAS